MIQEVFLVFAWSGFESALLIFTNQIYYLLKEIIIAVQSYFDAHNFIRKHNLWKWIIIPGLVYMILFVVSMYFFGKSASGVIEYIFIETATGSPTGTLL